MGSAGSSPKRATRRGIVDVLRGEIIAGRFAPGSLFPIRSELQGRFDTTPVTIQHAMDQLRREGFIYSNGRRATYVAPKPPHLYHYAMIFTAVPPADMGGWSRFYQSLVHVASGYTGSNGDPRRISVHYGIKDSGDPAAVRELVHAMRTRSCAGFIFPEHVGSSGLGPHPLGGEPGIPRVAVMGTPTDRVAAVCFDSASYVDKALSYFESRNRRRLAVLTNPQTPDFYAAVRSGAEKRGMVIRPYWIQQVSLEDPSPARGVVHLLLNPRQEERPDALFIADDNLVEHAKAGIFDAGVKVLDELEVVAHCNFPWPAANVLPVKRLGFDIRRALSACLDLLDEQRRGQAPGMRTIPAVFEEEIESSTKG